MAHGSHLAIPPDGMSWYPPRRPAVVQLDLHRQAAVLSHDLNRLLTGGARIEVREFRLAGPSPRAISVEIVRPPRPRVRSFDFSTFDQAGDDPALCDPPDTGDQPIHPLTIFRPGGSTRIKPPGDVIKLKDRLDYLLQPPLEALLAERSLRFPFQPFPYQLEGVAFLYPRQAAILADEMGLGKTMQAITAIRLLIRRGEIRRILLVCPKPLVTNWQREFDLWAPEIPLAVIEGTQTERRRLWQLPHPPVKIANYELLHRDQQWFGDDGQSADSAVEFDLIVLDESQRIKNRHGATNRAARAIAGRRRWALTGTPVENSPEDLVGIFELLAPGLLSSEMKPRRMGRAVSDYVLRRTKEVVLADLPPKLFCDAEMELAPQQQESYRMAEDEGVLRLSKLDRAATIGHIFELVLRLKQICNFDPATGESSKLERLQADLEEVAASGRKAIVFSQWVETLRRLADNLGRFGPLEYHGRIPSRRRDAVIRRFRDDPHRHVLLISYGAGGLGLNLQFANYVFLFDRWWNPAVEDQAINRVHRIGTAGPVTVVRFLMLRTIEERIERILAEKRELFETILSGAEQHRRLGLTQKELFGLFELQCPGGPIDLAA